MTPLMYAARLSILLGTPNINLNAKDAFGLTALHFACGAHGRTGSVRQLIEAGAGVNEADHLYGCTPLIFAVANGHLESIRLLINAPGIKPVRMLSIPV